MLLTSLVQFRHQGAFILSRINMLPRFSSNNIANTPCFYGEIFAYSGLVASLFAIFKNENNLFFCKLGMPIPFSKRVSFFGDAIRYVIFRCSYFKVMWIHTRGVIARMQQMFPFWDFAKFHFIRYSVCIFWSLFFIIKYIPITSCCFGASPLPTAIRLINPFPKPLCQRLRFSFVYTSWHIKIIIRTILQVKL